jgi:hypothetical protein
MVLGVRRREPRGERKERREERTKKRTKIQFQFAGKIA